MLDAVPLDALDICSPRQHHAGHVRAGAARGLALLCQKPLGIDLAEAEALVGDVEGKVPLMVHENWRFRPYYRRLAAWLDAELAGEIVSIDFAFHSSGMIAGADGTRPALVRQPFFRSLDRLLVMEVLIHHLDTLRFLFGEFDLVAARLRRSNDDIIGEDSAVLTLARRGDECRSRSPATSPSTVPARAGRPPAHHRFKGHDPAPRRCRSQPCRPGAARTRPSMRARAIRPPMARRSGTS